MGVGRRLTDSLIGVVEPRFSRNLLVGVQVARGSGGELKGASNEEAPVAAACSVRANP